MKDYENILEILINSYRNIRFVAICDNDGNILEQRSRKSTKNILSLEETKKALQRSINSWKSRAELEGKIGKGMYAIAAYEKIKRITIPLDENTLLYLSMDNRDPETGKFQNMTDMSKIVSLLELDSQ